MLKTATISTVGIGFVADLPANIIKPEGFSNVQNFTFRDGVPERVSGETLLSNGDGWAVGGAFPAYQLAYYNALGSDWWIRLCQNTLWASNGVITGDISRASMGDVTKNNQYSSSELNGILIINNGVGVPTYWDGDLNNSVKFLPGFPTTYTVKSVRTYKYFIIAMNITDAGTNYRDNVIWSESAEPGSLPTSWEPLPSNDAGSLALAATPGDIIDGLSLNDSFIIYKKRSIYAMNYVGGNDVFSLRKISEVTGLLCLNAVTAFRGLHYLITDSDIVRFDGLNIQSIIDGRNRKYFFATLDQENFENCFVVKRQTANAMEIWFCYPTTGNVTPNKALIYNVDSDTWGIRDLPRRGGGMAEGVVTESDVELLPIWADATQSWNNFVGVWDGTTNISSSFSLVSTESWDQDEGLNLYYMDSGKTFGRGEQVFGYLERIGILVDPFQRKKLTRRIWIDAESPIVDQKIYVRMGSHDAIGDAVVWEPEKVFTIGVDQKLDFTTNGRYLAVSFQSKDGQVWRLTNYSIDFRDAGVF
jgi:hypothetical protein